MQNKFKYMIFITNFNKVGIKLAFAFSIFILIWGF